MNESKSNNSPEGNMRSIYITMGALILTAVITVGGASYGYGEMNGRVAELERLAVSMDRLHGDTNRRQWDDIKSNTALTSRIDAKLAGVKGQLTLIIELLRQNSTSSVE
jgi:hypothetical protein